MTDPVTYVYAVARPFDEGILRDVPGVSGAPVRLIRSGALVALVSTVDAEDFGEQGLRRNLEDLAWLEKTVRSHNRVVETVARVASVIPSGLATVYYADDRVRAVLDERAEDLVEALDRIADHTEWGVKVYADTAVEAAREPAVAEGGQRPGAAYLQRLRKRRAVQDQAEQEALQRAGELHEALTSVADDSRMHPPQARELAHYEGRMLLNGAYLVDDARIEEFRAMVRAIGERDAGLRVDLTGPWPAYSFAAPGKDHR